jgi:hypothetical protein
VSPAYSRIRVRDADDLKGGDDFARELRVAVRSSAALLAIIGADWAELTDSTGRRRLEDPHDWVRVEIEEALSEGIAVIPVLLPGASMPSRARLPNELGALADRSAVQLRQECWADDVETLVIKLEGLGIRRQLIRIEPDTADRLTLVRQLRGHLGGVSDVAISPNGLKVVTAGGAPTMTSIGRLKDGDNVASLGDRTVRVWRIADGGTIHVLDGHSGWAVAVAVSPDGMTLASGDGETVRLWDLQTGAQIRLLQSDDRLGTALAFSPGGELLAAGSDGGVVTVWRLTDGALLRTSAKHRDRVTSVAFSPIGAVLASGSRDGTVRLWRSPGWDRPTTLRSGPRLGKPSAVRDLAFAPNRDVIAAACEDGRVRQWRVTDGNTLPGQAHRGGWATSVAFAPDGSVLGSGSSEGVLLLWPVAGGAPRELATDGNQINRLAFSADGGTLAAAVWNATTYLWRVRRQTGERR